MLRFYSIFPILVAVTPYALNINSLPTTNPSLIPIIISSNKPSASPSSSPPSIFPTFSPSVKQSDESRSPTETNSPTSRLSTASPTSLPTPNPTPSTTDPFQNNIPYLPTLAYSILPTYNTTDLDVSVQPPGSTSGNPSSSPLFTISSPHSRYAPVGILTTIVFLFISYAAILYRYSWQESNDVSYRGKRIVQLCVVSFQAVSLAAFLVSVLEDFSLQSRIWLGFALISCKSIGVIVWLIICSLFFGNGSPSLFLYLHKPAISTKVSEAIYGGLFFLTSIDLTLLLYMPWKRSQFTNLSRGSPNLAVFKIVIYGSLIVNALTFIVSVVNVSMNYSPILVIQVLFSGISAIQAVFSTYLRVELLSDPDRDMVLIDKASMKISIANNNDIEKSDINHSSNGNNNGILSSYSTEIWNQMLPQIKSEELEFLRSQIVGEPLEYMEYDELKRNIAIMSRNIESMDEALFDKLIRTLEIHLKYKQEKEEERAAWYAEMSPFCMLALDEMRGFIPPFRFECSELHLVEQGLSKSLAKRIYGRKCLWLIRLDPTSISKIHINDLQNKYGYDAQNLDIIEIAALYYSLPDNFLFDIGKKKLNWKLNLEKKLKEMHQKYKNESLKGDAKRNRAYFNQNRVFENNQILHSIHVMKAEDEVEWRQRDLELVKLERKLSSKLSYNKFGLRFSSLTSFESMKFQECYKPSINDDNNNLKEYDDTIIDNIVIDVIDRNHFNNSDNINNNNDINDNNIKNGNNINNNSNDNNNNINNNNNNNINNNSNDNNNNNNNNNNKIIII
eukprot:gene12425-16667_t